MPLVSRWRERGSRPTEGRYLRDLRHISIMDLDLDPYPTSRMHGDDRESKSRAPPSSNSYEWARKSTVARSDRPSGRETTPPTLIRGVVVT